ncbi:sister chromatid cohesion protein 1 [Linnemannia exigua]|uniref:Sister chromatid cohesion protein 1 n=1 Tax=Linnemannia exigua TaxID=604196 RepID=A0AAD4D1Z9_9FUNG|nr:sister chromatid cohesion protein 1 [Linnemannia exigua]
MFYSEAILSKKGPLAKVWLAAHWERKLSKNQFLQTNLNNSVDAIMGTDQAPMALRLSGQLLLGVARIYSRKTKYLLEDCNEALVKIKVAFRSDASNKDTNLLILDGETGDVAGNRSKAAFNAITVPDAMTEFDLLMPAQTIDIDAWGLNPKLNHAARAQDINLEDGNEDDLFAAGRDNYGLDNGRRHLGLDIEVGRNSMNRIGGGGYSTMDFDLGGDDDGLDLDMFGDAVDFDFMKRPHRRDDLEIEVGRREATRRSVSVDPFAMMPEGAKDLMRLGSVERAPSVARSVEEQPNFQDGLAPQERARSPYDFGNALDVEGAPVGDVQERHTIVKKRKLVVDLETEVAQELLLGANGDLIAEGLLVEHEMLPRSRKMLRLQQIEQDMAHGGLAGYLLDCSAGPRVMGGSMVPELASMFSRRLQIDQPAAPVAATAEGGAGAHWQDNDVGAWVDDVEPNEPEFGMHRMTPPPAADLFDGFQLDSPQKDTTRDHADVTEDTQHGEGSLSAAAKGKGRSTLFQDQDEIGGPAVSTKELHGTVFSHSAIQTMRLVQQGIESKKDGTEIETRQRSTRTTSMATASSAANKDNNTRVQFSELLAASNPTQQRRTRTDAAKLFFELLVLSTKDVIKVEQKESFGEIAVGGSSLLDTLVEADTNTADETPVAAAEVEVSA